MSKWDCIIVGGGAIGLCAAHLLAARHLRVCVLEARANFPADSRVLSLNPSSTRILQKMGLWAQLAPQATPIARVEISIQGRFPRAFLQEPDNSPLGHSLPLHHLQAVLAEQPPFACHYQVHLEDIAPTPTGWRLKDAKGTVYDTHLLIGADGAHSRVRQHLGIPAHTQSYAQTALVAQLRFTKPHQNQAYERLGVSGTLALIPMPDQQMALIWMLPCGETPEAWDAVFLKERLRQAFGDRLGAIHAIENIQCFPLYSSRSSADTARCAVLLGQAAHQMHPVGAQGFNLALEDVAVLMAELDKAVVMGEPITAPQRLIAYAMARTARHREVGGFIDRIARYVVGEKIPSALQAFGLQGLAWFPPAQAHIRQIGRGLWT